MVKVDTLLRLESASTVLAPECSGAGGQPAGYRQVLVTYDELLTGCPLARPVISLVLRRNVALTRSMRHTFEDVARGKSLQFYDRVHVRLGHHHVTQCSPRPFQRTRCAFFWHQHEALSVNLDLGC